MKPTNQDMPLLDDLDAERTVLGTALSDQEAFPQILGLLTADDFSLEKHKRIFLRMSELQDRGETITHSALAQELKKAGQLESVDGLSYLVFLSGVPHLSNLAMFCERVKDLANRRRAIIIAQSGYRVVLRRIRPPGGDRRSGKARRNS